MKERHDTRVHWHGEKERERDGWVGGGGEEGALRRSLTACQRNSHKRRKATNSLI